MSLENAYKNFEKDQSDTKLKIDTIQKQIFALQEQIEEANANTKLFKSILLQNIEEYFLCNLEEKFIFNEIRFISDYEKLFILSKISSVRKIYKEELTDNVISSLTQIAHYSEKFDAMIYSIYQAIENKKLKKSFASSFLCLENVFNDFLDLIYDNYFGNSLDFDDNLYLSITGNHVSLFMLNDEGVTYTIYKNDSKDFRKDIAKCLRYIENPNYFKKNR